MSIYNHCVPLDLSIQMESETVIASCNSFLIDLYITIHYFTVVIYAYISVLIITVAGTVILLSAPNQSFEQKQMRGLANKLKLSLVFDWLPFHYNASGKMDVLPAAPLAQKVRSQK